jgi:hypothetical protein
LVHGRLYVAFALAYMDEFREHSRGEIADA